jgi:K+-sensing histidine kinase KdpD
MEITTIELQAFKELQSKLDLIVSVITEIKSQQAERVLDEWMDNHDVCELLKISPKTLQRLRAAGAVTYSRINGKIFYRPSEIQRLMEEKLVRSSDEQLESIKKQDGNYYN